MPGYPTVVRRLPRDTLHSKSNAFVGLDRAFRAARTLDRPSCGLDRESAPRPPACPWSRRIRTTEPRCDVKHSGAATPSTGRVARSLLEHSGGPDSHRPINTHRNLCDACGSAFLVASRTDHRMVHSRTFRAGYMVLRSGVCACPLDLFRTFAIQSEDEGRCG